MGCWPVEKGNEKKATLNQRIPNLHPAPCPLNGYAFLSIFCVEERMGHANCAAASFVKFQQRRFVNDVFTMVGYNGVFRLLFRASQRLLLRVKMIKQEKMRKAAADL